MQKKERGGYMKIAIIDADLIGKRNHRFPNLACMKLSAYYKSSGNDVSLVLSYDNLNEYDQVFISKVFTDTVVPDGVLELPNVKYGGTGFYYDKAPPLDPEIEHIKPDYHLYDAWVKEKIDCGVKPKKLTYYIDFSIGFMTRGCIRQCSFCVNKNYKQCNRHSSLEEFLDKSRPYICLLDDNVLSCKDWKSIFLELQAINKPFQFKQGMDERLLTDEKCEVIFKSNWIGDYIFAFDNIKDADIIENKLKLIREHTNIVPKFYLFCGYNHQNPNTYTDEFWLQDIIDMFERIRILMQYKCLPYIMRYLDYTNSPFSGTYINAARWCNQPSLFKKMSYREFCEANGVNSICYKRMVEFEKKYPQISKKYFNLKFGGNLNQQHKTHKRKQTTDNEVKECMTSH